MPFVFLHRAHFVRSAFCNPHDSIELCVCVCVFYIIIMRARVYVCMWPRTFRDSSANSARALPGLIPRIYFDVVAMLHAKFLRVKSHYINNENRRLPVQVE